MPSFPPSDPHQVELLAQPGMESAPALVVFSKTDVKPAALSEREVRALMRLDALMRARKGRTDGRNGFKGGATMKPHARELV